MIINRSHTPWAIFVILVTVGCGVLYLANFHPEMLPFHVALPAFFGPVPPMRRTVGGTPLGLIFGTVALLIFLFASALGIRKKKRVWPIGNVKLWLKAHIWLTILTMPLVAFHCGFHRGGAMPTLLLVLYALVMGSGFFGLALQQFMPGLMTSRITREVVYEEIPHLRRQILEAALAFRSELRAVAEKTGVAALGGRASVSALDAAGDTIARCMDEECLPYLFSKSGKRSQLAKQATAENYFRVMRLHTSEKWSPRVDELEAWCDDRRQMDLQLSMHHWLHGWLLIHVPISFALLIVTFWHAYATVVYL